MRVSWVRPRTQQGICPMRYANNALMIQLSVLATVLTLLLAGSEARSQNGDVGDAPSAAIPSPANQRIDDATLKRTAAAYVKVQRIEQYGQQALAGASTDTQKQQIAQQVEAKKLTAVEAEGLQPEQYNQVVQLAMADQTFQHKFLSYVRTANDAAQSPD
jgi:hypothetical protein